MSSTGSNRARPSTTFVIQRCSAIVMNCCEDHRRGWLPSATPTQGADPVSGAGMSKALMELAELRALLGRRPVRDAAFVRAYYRRIRRTTDVVWSVIREQNLRFPWIHDVKRKRPFHFRLQNWYVDRVFESLHEIRRSRSRGVTLRSATALARHSRDSGQGAQTSLSRQAARGGTTLIERNFGNPRDVKRDAMPRCDRSIRNGPEVPLE